MRGLKLKSLAKPLTIKIVAPFAGAWIEIGGIVVIIFIGLVAPFAGAWIEISIPSGRLYHVKCRTLRGCVD